MSRREKSTVDPAGAHASVRVPYSDPPSHGEDEQLLLVLRTTASSKKGMMSLRGNGSQERMGPDSTLNPLKVGVGSSLP